jgi:ABC-type glycerol-3-phosphate transport system substrate-binding protein
VTNAAHVPVRRRQLLLHGVGILAGSSLLAACGGAASPVQATVAAATSTSRPLVTASNSTAVSSSASAAVPATTARLASAGGALSVFLPTTGSLAPGWKLLMPRFQAANPTLKVGSSPTLDVTKLQAVIAAGTPPDVTHFDRYQVVTWSVKGLFQPVDDLLRALDPAKTFLTPTVKEATYQGKLYAMPQDTGIRGLFWNVAQLQQAGLDAQQGPQSWDDLNHYAQALTQQGGDASTQRFGFLPWISNWSHIGWIWTFGGDYFDDKTFRPTLNRPENVQAFDWMLGYAKRYGTPDAPEWDLAGRLLLRPAGRRETSGSGATAVSVPGDDAEPARLLPGDAPVAGVGGGA